MTNRFGTQVTRYQDASNKGFRVATAPAAVPSPTNPFTATSGTTITITATAPSDRGTKANGTAVAANDIKYRLYYALVGGAHGVPIQVNAAAAIKRKVDDTNVMDVIAGKVEIQGNTALTTGFRVTGISEDTLYQYFIRSTHPNGTLHTDTSETLVFVLKPKQGHVVVISATLNGKPRTAIDDNEYKRTGSSHIRHAGIPSSVTTIDKNAFQDNRLKRVDISNNVTIIGEYAFDDNRIESITIGNKVTKIAKGVLKDNYLKSVTIPSTVITEIENDAFTVNKNLKTVTLKESLFNTMNKAKRNSVFGSQVIVYIKLSDGRTLWRQPQIYAVQFKTNGGTEVDTKAVSHGSRVTAPNPTKTNFVLFGWYTDSAFTRVFNFTTKITSDTTFHAKWASTWKTVAAGAYHTVGIKTNDTLWAWGYNEYGQIGNRKSGRGKRETRPVQVGTYKWKAVAAGDITQSPYIYRVKNIMRIQSGLGGVIMTVRLATGRGLKANPVGLTV